MSDARVGGHLVSDTELDDIARDEVSQREGREPCAIVEHHGVVGLDLPQCMEHLLGVGLLPDVTTKLMTRTRKMMSGSMKVENVSSLA
jgi:hypothetical protein